MPHINGNNPDTLSRWLRPVQPDGPAGALAGARLLAALAGQTAWASEADEALRLARERSLRLDAAALAWGDVRDLQALARELRRIPIPRAHIPRPLRRYLNNGNRAYI